MLTFLKNVILMINFRIPVNSAKPIAKSQIY